MRSKLIITGAIGIMAAATLTVNAQNAVLHLGAKPVSATLVAPRSIDTDRENVTIAVRATESPEAGVTESAKPEASEASRTEDESKPEPKAAVSAECQAAIANLKAMHQADVAEDASERTTANDESAAAIAADKSEDMTEASTWVAALKDARTKCVPQLPVRCESALSGLQTVFMTLRAQEAAEPQGATQIDAAADFAAVRTAFSAIATACGAHE